MKPRRCDVASYQSPEMYAGTYPLPMSMKAEVTSPTKYSGNGVIIYSQLDNSSAASYVSPTKSINESPFTDPWKLYHSRPQHSPEKHPLKLLQDFNDNSLKTLSQPQGVKQPVTSATVLHRSPERPMSPTLRTSMASDVRNTTSQGE